LDMIIDVEHVGSLRRLHHCCFVVEVD
jgi:hypothetical protein